MENNKNENLQYNDEYVKLQNFIFADMIDSINFDIENINNFDITYLNGNIIYSFNINNFEDVTIIENLKSNIIIILYTKGGYIYILNTKVLTINNFSNYKKLIDFIYKNIEKIDKVTSDEKNVYNNFINALLYSDNNEMKGEFFKALYINDFKSTNHEKNYNKKQKIKINYDELTKDELIKEIDKALDNGNKKLFNKLTKILNKKFKI